MPEQLQSSGADGACGLANRGQGGPSNERRADGQEEVFSRTNVELGRIEHKAVAGSGEEATTPFGTPRA